MVALYYCMCIRLCRFFCAVNWAFAEARAWEGSVSSFNVTMDVTMEMRGTFLRTARKNIMDLSRESLEIQVRPTPLR